MSETDGQGADPKVEAGKAAREYAWHWFEYHAGQRQTVFRFFLIFAGAAGGAYLTAAKTAGFADLGYWFGVILIVLAVLFYRLDVRSRGLIECAETYLRRDEAQLAKILGTNDVLISQNAHDARTKVHGIARHMFSFYQVYKILFCCVGLVGVLILIFDSKSPVRSLVAVAISRVFGS